MTEKISVALCTYNGEKYLEEQLDSIVGQTRRVDEIVVCDDGSTDDTLAILEKYAQQHPDIFRIIRNEVNLRSVKNFEKAMTLCTGDIIFLSDQDDKWVLNKVEDYLAFFKSHPKIQILASNGYCIDENSAIEEKYAVWDVPQFLREENIAVDYYKIIANVANLATGATMAVKKEIFPEIMPFPVYKGYHHDEWMALIASRKKAFELLNNKYFYYRIHEHQQVGGVFFDQIPRLRQLVFETFDIDNYHYSYAVLKRRLRIFVRAYEKNLFLHTYVDKYNADFADNMELNKKYLNETRRQMRLKSLIRALFQEFTDKITNKRQLKKM